VEAKVYEKFKISLSDPELKLLYPNLRKHKYLNLGLNIDIAALSKIIKAHADEFCPNLSIFYR